MALVVVGVAAFVRARGLATLHRAATLGAPPSGSGFTRRRSRPVSDSRIANLLGTFGRWRSTRRRGAALRGDLALVAEMVRMAVTAGLTPVQALRTVGPLAPPASAGVLSIATTSLDLGLDLDAALDRLRQAAPELTGLADALSASAHLGVGIDTALARVSDEARATVRRRAEARARTVPVRLLFPLVVCVLPAFALLGVAPSLLAGLTA